jgi:LPXTG-site transpeptidase (sortase) family protein
MILTGITVLFIEFGPLAMAEVAYRKDKLFDINYSLPAQIITSGLNQSATPSASIATSNQAITGFGQLPEVNEKIIQPISSDYGIVIEKINANAKVVANVDAGDQDAYVKALSEGVAEAKGSTKPGEAGNLFLFAHSTDAPWNIIRYNAIFYLLRELEVGDKISVFYQGRRYDYIVYDKVIVPGSDVSFLTNRYDKPVLTLQTCDPPGTTLNRLMVRARLIGS